MPPSPGMLWVFFEISSQYMCAVNMNLDVDINNAISWVGKRLRV